MWHTRQIKKRTLAVEVLEDRYLPATVSVAASLSVAEHAVAMIHVGASIERPLQSAVVVREHVSTSSGLSSEAGLILQSRSSQTALEILPPVVDSIGAVSTGDGIGNTLAAGRRVIDNADPASFGDVPGRITSE